ncbi:hypothetical protein EA462_03465 [Natrarchaeobius halalkaliphilus]|uniref:DUF7978 domain-containing protein n=1 Tax=Natrarchaeobius halalkaliphilus TaxID=1679091 RepID=A0A3N6LTA9_9EURY|nr:hypothetical protein [Natrarchaeobius halalkaliphilus]RQG93263.1 hypothetical protein EA462_03465 [Natrarchaeobius halalkaliphilus]
MSQQPLAATERSVSRASSVAASAGVGVLAAVIGYLVTYVAVAGEVEEAVGDSVAEWKGVAWYYYNAHLVDIDASGEIGSIGGSRTVDFIAQSGSTSATLLYVVPPLVLLGVGAMVAYQFDARDLGEAVIAGAPVTIGYAVVMGLGAVVTEASTEGSFFGVDLSGSIAPQLVPAIFLGGVLYPLVFATAGAILATVLASR